MSNLDGAVLRRLVDGERLSREAAREALTAILSGDVPDVVIASFLTALAARGETAEEMTGFVDAMMNAAVTFEAPVGAIDVVGTGGDGAHSVNVSTMAALTVAGCGVPVAKHGNRAASSSVGTADVLEALGVRIDLDADGVVACVTEAGMGFCFAQRFHPGFRFLGPIRRSLGFPTAFNVLGPMANPGGVRRLVIGVANEAMMDRMAEVLSTRGVDRAILMHAHDGLDELSLGAPATLRRIDGDVVRTESLDAAAVLGVRHDASTLRGGDVDRNVSVVLDFVAGSPGPVFDVVTANAALALVVADRVSNLTEGYEMARDAVRNGAAATVLAKLIDVSNR